MSKWPASWRVILLLVFCCILSGCLPSSDTPVDDEKDPNFIEGRNHYNMMDWKGAVEAYERTVQANPRNASAHFELGVLYQDRMNDPLAAAYHYQKHLQLRPKSEYLEAAKQRLDACKMELAKSVTFVVVNQDIRRDLTRLTNELTVAREQANSLRALIAAKPTVVTQWMKFTVTNHFTNYIQVGAAQPNTQYATPARPVQTNTLTRTNPPPARVTPLVAANTNVVRRGAAPPTGPVTRADIRPPAVAAPKVRAYTVRSGETMAEVARRFGVPLQKLLAANPAIQPRNLKAGQTVNIPSQ
jgi:LysM repeat protein